SCESSSTPAAKRRMHDRNTNNENEQTMNRNLNDKELDELIRGTLLSVSAPAELREKLLGLEPDAPQSRPWHAFISANDGIFRRVLPVAACLVVALGIAFWSSGDGQVAL